MKFIWSLIKDWAVFLIHPRDLTQDLPLKSIIKSLIFHFFFLFLVSASLMIITNYLFRKLYFQWHIIPYPVTTKPHYYITFLYVVITGPVIEELMCRLSLRFRPLFLAISASVLAFFITARFIIRTDPFFNIRYTLGNLFIVLVMALLLYFFMRSFKDTLTIFWNKYFRLIFYAFALLFGYMHLGNYYMDHYSMILLSPFFIFPYIFIGLNLGYIRLKYGIVFSILLHGFYNAFPLILTFVFHVR
jgi:hypothetical protein